MTTYLSPGIYTKETDFSFYVKQISTASAGMVGIAERGPINKPSLVTSWEQFTKTYGGYIHEGYLAYAARAFFDNGGRVLYVNRVAHLNDPLARTSLSAKPARTKLQDRRGETASLETGDLLWEARHPGNEGNQISVTLEASGNNTMLSVFTEGSDIRISLGTDGEGKPTNTPEEVAFSVSQDAMASLLVSVVPRGDTLVEPLAKTHLTGGVDSGGSLDIMAVDEGRWGNDLVVIVQTSDRNPGDHFDLFVKFKGNLVENHLDLSMDESSKDHVEIRVNGFSDFILTRDLGPMSVVPDDRPTVGQFALIGGDDGLDDLTDQDYVGDPSARTGLFAFDEIDALNLLSVPGVTTAPVIQAGLSYCENRKDVFFIAEAPLHLEPLEVIQWRKGLGSHVHAAFNSSYGAVYYPWLQISDPLTGSKKRVPPSGVVSGCIARSDQQAFVWSAPAGINRGRVFNVLNVDYKISQGEMDALYPEGINPIISLPDAGLVLWGQRTLTFTASALDRINVRRLMIYMEEAISESSRFVVFEPNNPQTWRALKRLLSPFLHDIKENGGLYEWRVQCDEETNTPAVIDRNQIITRVFVKPTKTAEFIELNFVLTSTGAAFSEIFGDGR